MFDKSNFGDRVVAIRYIKIPNLRLRYFSCYGWRTINLRRKEV